MTPLYKRKLKNNRFNLIVDPHIHSKLEYLSFGIVKLPYNGRYHNLHHNEECCVVLLKGKFDIKINHSVFKGIGPRKNVFDEKAYAVYIPPSSKYEIHAKSKNLEVAVCRARTKGKAKSEVKLVVPDGVKEKISGRDNWERKVYAILDKDSPAEKLIVGETIIPPGNWMGPPHKHDRDNIPVESKHEEIYFYRVCPSNGFAMQRMYTADKSIDQSYIIKNNDLMVITKGYHPVVAAPGYKLYYLWMLAGKRRISIAHCDPQHAWIEEAL